MGIGGASDMVSMEKIPDVIQAAAVASFGCAVPSEETN